MESALAALRRVPVSLLGGRSWEQVRGVGRERKPLGVQADHHHEVETQEGQVGEVVPSQGLVTEVRVDEAQAAKARLAGAQTLEVGEEDRPCVPHHDVLDLSLAVREDADLAARLAGELSEVARQLLGQDLVWGDLAAVDVLDPLDLTRFEPLGVAVESIRGKPPGRLVRRPGTPPILQASPST